MAYPSHAKREAVLERLRDGRFAIWCAAPPGNQELLVAANADRFFRPPYVGHRGWLGVQLNDGVDWDELEGIVEDAFASVAPKSLRAGAEQT
jgi:hypothetical protein